VVAVCGLVNIGEFERFGDQGVDVMGFGDDDVEGSKGLVVGEEVGMCDI
jgi:hypothetical protein